MKVTPGLNSTVQIPSDGVLDSGFNTDYAHGADPNFSGFGVLPGSLLDLKLNSSLELCVRERGLEARKVKLSDVLLGLTPALFAFAHQYQLCSSE